MDRGDADDCVEAKLAQAPFRALVTAVVDPKWVTQ